MISPQEIRKKALKWWEDKSFLSAWIKGEEFFPREIPQIGLIKPSEVLSKFSKIIQEQEALIAESKEKKGYGYLIERKEIDNRKIGNSKFISRIYFDNEKDFVKLIKKDKEFRAFQENVALIQNEIPQLKEWLIANPNKIVENDKKWPDLLKVCKYFLYHHIPGKFYIRELPIKVHTKFIKDNEAIIRCLLDFLIPDKMNPEGKYFENRYFLKYAEPLIRIRLLDKEKPLYAAFTDMSFPLSDFMKLKVNQEKVFITENLMNFLTLPPINDAVAIWGGGGFSVSVFENIDWLKTKQIYYWGDLDAHGMQILSQMRGYFDHTQPIMMDFATLNDFKEDWGESKRSFSINLAHLTEEEFILFNFLKDNNIRMEQEKINQEYALKKIFDTCY